MKVVVVKKNPTKETNPVTVPMEGIEAIIQSEKSAVATVGDMQKALQSAYMELEAAKADIVKYKQDVAYLVAERQRLLDKIDDMKSAKKPEHNVSNTSTSSSCNCSTKDCDCKSKSNDATEPPVRRIWVMYI